METIFDPKIRNELIGRLERLTPNAERQWGKMSPAQMMEHTARALDMAMGKKPMKQIFLGKMLSWIFRKEFLGEKPFKQGRPTGPDFIIKDEPDFEIDAGPAKRIDQRVPRHGRNRPRRQHPRLLRPDHRQAVGRDAV